MDTINKKRINAFVVGGDIDKVEFWFAINGIKAIGFADGHTREKLIDWEMENRGAAVDLVKACDVIVAGDDTNLAAAKALSVRAGVPAYSLVNASDTVDMCGFESCVKACWALLGRDTSNTRVFSPK